MSDTRQVFYHIRINLIGHVCRDMEEIWHKELTGFNLKNTNVDRKLNKITRQDG